MKLLSLCSLLLLAPLAAWSLPSSGPAGASLVESDDTPLGEQMHAIEEGVKKLRRSLRDPANQEASLALVAEIQAASLACKALVPVRATEVPEAERPEFLRAYRKVMAEFLRHQLDLEIALIDGDEDAIHAAFSAVRKLEDPSHERFANEED